MKVPGRENAREWGHWGEGQLLRAWDSKTSGGKKPRPPVPARPLYLLPHWNGAGSPVPARRAPRCTGRGRRAVAGGWHGRCHGTPPGCCSPSAPCCSCTPGCSCGARGSPCYPTNPRQDWGYPTLFPWENHFSRFSTGKGVPLHQEGGPAPKDIEVQGKWQGFEDSTLRWQERPMPCVGMNGCTRDQHDANSGWRSVTLRVTHKVPRSL